MRKSILFIFLVLNSLGLWAQGSFTSENGLFTVNYLKGCTFTEVEVTLNNTTGTPFLCFDADLSDIGANTSCFGDPAQDPPDFRFTYQEAGTYDILFLRQFTNSQVYDSISIEILDPKTPFISFANCSSGLALDLDAQQEGYDLYTVDYGDGSPSQQYSINTFPVAYAYADPTQQYTITVTGEFDTSGNNSCSNNVFTRTLIPADQNESSAEITSLDIISDSSFQIDFELNQNQIYQLQIKENENGTYQTLTTFEGDQVNMYSFTNRDLINSFYCVRIITNSSCTGEDLFSNEACTIRFSGSAEQNGNLLDWNHDTFQNSELFKNGVLIYSGNAPFIDEDVFCGQSDQYQVITTDASGLNVESLPIQLEAIGGGAVEPITQIAVKVLSDSEVELSWEVPQGLQPSTFVVYKKLNLEDEFSELDTTSNGTYIDPNGLFDSRNYYYTIAYENNCGDISSIETTASNILLRLNQEGSFVNFDWNAYTGFDSLFNENVMVKYDANMNIVDQIRLGSDTTYSEDIIQNDTQLAFYQIQAISDNGLLAISNLIRYKIPPSFFVPSAFTPNTDGRNEEIKVVGKFIEEVEFSIYNRWGTLLFRSNELEIGWDGFLKDRPAPEGTYTYTVRVTDQYEEEYFKSGVFNLIR